MASKPSDSSWADGPFQLIATPSMRLTDTHSSVEIATEMALVHNIFIRGLNAIILQAPHVPTVSEDNYNASTVTGLFFFVNAWVKAINHHHAVEEELVFPELDKLSGTPGLMDDPRHQHEVFHGGLQRLMAYATVTKPEEYRWEDGMKEIVDSFSKDLVDHLYAEIDVLLGLRTLDSAGLKQMWDDADKLAKKDMVAGLMYDVIPIVLGCDDKTYEGGHNFPSLPWFVPYIIKYWFTAGNNAWRFSPSDWWGQPRPLTFTAQNK